MPAELSIEAAPPLGSAPTRAHRLLDRVRSHLRLKLGLFAGLSMLFCVPYFLLGHFPTGTPQTLPLTFIDNAIPFDPRWVYVYKSLYLLLPLSPFLAQSTVELKRYVMAFALHCAAGFTIFLLFPTRCPRPADPRTNDLYSLLVSYDPPTNAFPSMHIALGVQSLLFGISLLKSENSPGYGVLAVVGSLWLSLIAYATLATRQHYAVDLFAGAALAVLCHACVFYRRRS